MAETRKMTHLKCPKYRHFDEERAPHLQISPFMHLNRPAPLFFTPSILISLIVFSILFPSISRGTPLSSNSCEQSLSSLSAQNENTPLSNYFSTLELEGLPQGEGRWLLGSGFEGHVERVKTENGFHVEKHFSSTIFSQLNFSLLTLLKSFEITSFKTYEDFQYLGATHKYPSIRGISLIQILENPKVPQGLKEKLWQDYENRLASLLNELTDKRKDLFFQVSHLKYFDVIKDRLPPKENLHFLELRIAGIPSTDQRFTFRQRFLIEVYQRKDTDEDPQVLEPKPDNILVNLETLEMTWIDPN